jgi:hypothetical protein
MTIDELYKEIDSTSNMIGGSYRILRMGVVQQVANYIKGCSLLTSKLERNKLRYRIRLSLKKAGRPESRAKWYRDLIVWLSFSNNQSIRLICGSRRLVLYMTKMNIVITILS